MCPGRGELEAARELAEQSLTESRAISSDRKAAFAHLYLGDIARDCRQFEDAAVSYRECLRINCVLWLKPGIVECAEHLGWLAVELRQPERAAALMSFASSLRDVMRVPLAPEARARHDQALARSRAALDDASFQSAWNRGVRMTVEELEELA